MFSPPPAVWPCCPVLLPWPPWPPLPPGVPDFTIIPWLVFRAMPRVDLTVTCFLVKPEPRQQQCEHEGKILRWFFFIYFFIFILFFYFYFYIIFILSKVRQLFTWYDFFFLFVVIRSRADGLNVVTVRQRHHILLFSCFWLYLTEKMKREKKS